MKTLQNHYNAIKEGKGNKDQFLKQARTLFPEYFNQYTDFDTATNVLKSKQIISEAAGGVIGKGFDIWDWKKILAEETKAVEKETSKEVLDNQKNVYNNKDMKNADNVNFNEIMKGFYCEMKDPVNKEKTGDEIKAMVVKNLAKDPLYYTKNGEFGTKGVGYTIEAPGLGEPKEPKGKHKSSGYGDLKENINKKLHEGSININGKIVRTYTQNGDKSYNVTYDDGTKETIAVSNDAWDEINILHKNATKDTPFQEMTESEQKLRSLIRNIIKEELNEGYGMSLEDAKAEAQRISKEEGVVQHVEETRPGSGEYRVSDWYDSDLTVASYNRGMEL